MSETPETFEVPMDHPQDSQGELDRIWNDIRSTLASTAMKNMTIPQAKVFSAEATLYIGGHIRKLVDVEIAAHTTTLEAAKREAREEGGTDGRRYLAELQSLLANCIDEGTGSLDTFGFGVVVMEWLEAELSHPNQPKQDGDNK